MDMGNWNVENGGNAPPEQHDFPCTTVAIVYINLSYDGDTRGVECPTLAVTCDTAANVHSCCFAVARDVPTNKKNKSGGEEKEETNQAVPAGSSATAVDDVSPERVPPFPCSPHPRGGATDALAVVSWLAVGAVLTLCTPPRNKQELSLPGLMLVQAPAVAAAVRRSCIDCTAASTSEAPGHSANPAIHFFNCGALRFTSTSFPVVTAAREGGVTDVRRVTTCLPLSLPLTWKMHNNRKGTNRKQHSGVVHGLTATASTDSPDTLHHLLKRGFGAQTAGGTVQGDHMVHAGARKAAATPRHKYTEVALQELLQRAHGVKHVVATCVVRATTNRIHGMREQR